MARAPLFNGCRLGMGWEGHGSDDMGMKWACRMGLSNRVEMCEIMGIVGKLDTRSAGRYAWNFLSESLRPKGRKGKADALFNFVWYATDNCTTFVLFFFFQFLLFNKVFYNS